MQDSNHWCKHQNGFYKKTEDNLFILKTFIHDTNTVNNKTALRMLCGFQ